MSFINLENVAIELRDAVGLITLNRPENNNALSVAMFQDLTTALDQLEANEDIAAIVITGSDKAFAAGADVTEIKDKNFIDVYNEQFITAGWERITTCRKPVIAAVAGYAVGGGCEIAMMSDFIIAADNALFAQPEVKLGTIPGAGGTQRLTRLVGKSKAMDMCLTGRMMDADEAERSGLVSRVVPVAELVDDAMKTAAKIASFSRPAVMMAKSAVNISQETPLSQGVQMERNLFYSTYSLHDQKEGMAAFVEKRRPEFKHK